MTASPVQEGDKGKSLFANPSREEGVVVTQVWHSQLFQICATLPAPAELKILLQGITKRINPIFF